jgi:hypothetical protein
MPRSRSSEGLLPNQSHAEDGAVIPAGAPEEINRYWLVPGEGIAKKLQHALTSGPVPVVAELKTEPFARLTIEQDDRFNVQKVVRGAKTGTQVVDPEKSDPPLCFQEIGRFQAALEICFRSVECRFCFREACSHLRPTLCHLLRRTNIRAVREILVKVCLQRIDYRPSVTDDLLEPATVWHKVSLLCFRFKRSSASVSNHRVASDLQPGTAVCPQQPLPHPIGAHQHWGGQLCHPCEAGRQP